MAVTENARKNKQILHSCVCREPGKPCFWKAILFINLHYTKKQSRRVFHEGKKKSRVFRDFFQGIWQFFILPEPFSSPDTPS